MVQDRQRMGIACLCEAQGRIVQIVRDDLQVAANLPPGAHLEMLFADAENVKVAAFLTEINTHAATFDWVLTLRHGPYAGPLYVAGGKVEGRLLIVGALSRSEAAARFYEELMQINNEQMNALRAALKEQALLTQQQRERELLDVETYNQLTHLNNELMALQREMAKTNAELIAQRERYRLISESISDYAYAYRLGENGEIEYEWITGAFLHITGYQPEEIIPGVGMQPWIYADDRPLLAERAQQLAAGQVVVTEFRLVTKQGTVRWLRDYGRPIWNQAHTRVVRVYGAVQDVTERKDMQLQLATYTTNLEALVAEKIRELELERAKVIQAGKMASLGEMATGVAHELNQPLTALQFEADYLKTLARRALSSGDLSLHLKPEELLQVAENIASDIARSRRIIDHLRAFGRMSHEACGLLLINRSIEDAFIFTAERLRQRDILVIKNLAPDLPAVWANTHKLEQVFLNLISNAEYALTEMAQRMRQAGRTDYQKTLTITSYADAENVYVSVSDNGIGISPENQARLFQPFFTTKPVGEGTGLGLSISYGIIAEAGGEITCTSVENEGTTFLIRLPRAENRNE